MVHHIIGLDEFHQRSWVVPAWLLQLAEYAGVTLDRIERIARVISPLAFEPTVPWSRRFLYAATADRLVPPATVRARAVGPCVSDARECVLPAMNERYHPPAELPEDERLIVDGEQAAVAMVRAVRQRLG